MLRTVGCRISTLAAFLGAAQSQRIREFVLDRGVELRHVGPVVEPVVELHGARVDEGLEGVVRERLAEGDKRGQ